MSRIAHIHVNARKTALMIGVLCASISGTSNAATLSEAVSATLKQHPQVKSAIAQRDGAQAGKQEQLSAFYPQLRVNGSAGRIYGNNSTSRGLTVTRGSGTSNMWEASLSATQPLYDGAITRNRVDAAEAQANALNFTLNDTRESLAFRTVQTYVELTRVYKGLMLLRGQEQSVEQYLGRIRAMVDDGAGDEAELQQAIDVSVILDNFINDYIGQARILDADFKELTGLNPDDEFAPARINIALIPSDAKKAAKAAKVIHPLLKAARAYSVSAERQIDAEKGAYFPTLDGELSVLKSEKDDVLGGELEDARALLRMNWGFETGGAQKARVRQRTSEYKDRLARIEDTERQIERGIRQAYAEYQTAQRQLKNQKRRYELNKKLLQTYKVQFEGARISVLQLMQADNQVLITKLDASNAQNRVLLAQYAILSAMGKLQAALNTNAPDKESFAGR